MRKPLTLIVLVTALVVVPPAAAKTWFGSVGGKTFGVGQVVVTEIAGCPIPCPPRGTVVYLSPAAKRDTTVRLGVVDRAGRLRFRVPKVTAGSYRLVARPAPRLGPVQVSAPFRVR